MALGQIYIRIVNQHNNIMISQIIENVYDLGAHYVHWDKVSEQKSKINIHSYHYLYL